jgi:ribosome-binding protein aMBF1 (putative translation factor)
MDAAERKALEAQGYRVYDHPGDAVGMNEEEKHELDFRLSLSRAVRNRREKLGLSIKELAAKLKVSQAKAAKIEIGNYDVTLEQMLHAYAVMGGRLTITELPPHPVNGKVKKKARTTA